MVSKINGGDRQRPRMESGGGGGSKMIAEHSLELVTLTGIVSVFSRLLKTQQPAHLYLVFGTFYINSKQ